MDETKKTASLSDAVQIIYLDKNNAQFRTKNNFLTLKAKIPNENGTVEDKEYDRVFLHRAFPFDNPFEYISVLDADQKEIGLIRDVGVFETEVQEYLKAELGRKYFAQKLSKIIGIKERYGFSYWKAATEDGEEITFTLQDTFRSIMKVGGESKRIFIIDIDGNRYEIPDLEKLEFKSYKKLELYL